MVPVLVTFEEICNALTFSNYLFYWLACVPLGTNELKAGLLIFTQKGSARGSLLVHHQRAAGLLNIAQAQKILLLMSRSNPKNEWQSVNYFGN